MLPYTPFDWTQGGLFEGLRCFHSGAFFEAHALATGLRVSELLALKWQDIDFSNNTLTPARGIVDNHVGGLKTVTSGNAVPCSQEVADVLAAWHKRTLYPEPTDWVFPPLRRWAASNRTGRTRLCAK